MKAKTIILLGFLFLMVGNTLGQNWNKISKEIKKQQLSEVSIEEKDINCYYDLRKKSDILNKMEIIPAKDTIFILQIHREVDVFNLYMMIWNNIDTLSVDSKDSGKTFQITNQQTFTNYMMKLVSEWNLEEIKKEEVKNSMRPSDGIFATRIIFNGKKCKIDCFHFKNFFNLERDGVDFSN